MKKIHAKYVQLAEAVKKLRVGDLVLVHTRGDFASSMIQSATGSYWEHVTIVFDVPHRIDKGVSLDEVLVAEIVPFRPLAIHRLQIFLGNKDRYDIGIKSMDFLTDQERERFIGFFLQSLDSKYDRFRLLLYFMQIICKYISRCGFIVPRLSNFFDTNRYVCSTLAQRAYYLAVSPERRFQTIFRSQDKKIGFLTQMEDVTPSTIARSTNTVWLYNPHY